jgi:2'-5' RNA ligase
MPLLIKKPFKASPVTTLNKIKEQEGSRCRVFFAIWPDGALQQRLHQTGSAVSKACQGRLMRQETLHLTLLFIGDIARSRVADLIAMAAPRNIGSCEMVFDHFESWKRAKVGALVPQSVPVELVELVNYLRAQVSALGLSFDHQGFRPHVTLLRNITEPKALPVQPVRWQAGSFVLVESQLSSTGASYRILHSWPMSSV